MMERSVNSALEKSKERLSRVGVGVSPHIFALAVVYNLVATLELFSDPGIGFPLVGHDRGVFLHEFPDRSLEGLRVDALNHSGLHLARAGYQGHHGGFALRAAPTDSLAGLPADVRLVYLNLPGEGAAEGRVFHGVTDTVAHEPSRLVGELEAPVDLVSRDPLLRGRHEVDRGEPLGEGDVGAFKDGSHGDSERLAALRTLVEARASGLPTESVSLGGFAARTGRALGPELALKITTASLVRAVLLDELDQARVVAVALGSFGHCFVLHLLLVYPREDGYVKYIIPMNYSVHLR